MADTKVHTPGRERNDSGNATYVVPTIIQTVNTRLCDADAGVPDLCVCVFVCVYEAFSNNSNAMPKQNPNRMFVPSLTIGSWLFCLLLFFSSAFWFGVICSATIFHSFYLTSSTYTFDTAMHLRLGPWAFCSDDRQRTLCIMHCRDRRRPPASEDSRLACCGPITRALSRQLMRLANSPFFHTTTESIGKNRKFCCWRYRDAFSEHVQSDSSDLDEFFNRLVPMRAHICLIIECSALIYIRSSPH